MWNTRGPFSSPWSSGRGELLVPLVVLVLLSVVGEAQGQIPDTEERRLSVVLGTVVDVESGDPLQAVQVTARVVGDTTVVASVLSDPSGAFRFPALLPGRYSLSFSRIGYAVLTTEVDIRPGAAFSLGPTALLASALEIPEVTVVADRPAVVYEADRDVYSVEALAAAAGGTATDALGEIPEIEVDGDGGITLRGERPAIYVNGRPAPMRGDALDQFLQGFPAENIESIEVMTSPSARYGSEGAGGIVNIVLKRGVGLGLTGNVSLNAGTRGELGTSGRVTNQGSALTVLASGSLRTSQRETNSTELRQNLRSEPVTYLEQNALSNRSTWSANLDLSAEYSFDQRTTGSVEGRIRRNDAGSDRITTYTEMLEDWTITDRYDRTAIDASDGTSTDLGVELRRVFTPRRHELTVEARLRNGADDQESVTRRRILADAFPEDETFQLMLDEAREHDRQLELGLDYRRPLGSVQLETGFGTRSSTSDVDRLRTVGIDAPGAPVNTLERTDFLHRETVSSLYVTGTRRLGSLNAQVGLRAEHTGLSFELPGESAPFENSYLNVFPNANLTYQVDRSRRVRLSYSVRVRRPTANVLNPTDRSTDPLNRRVGNPEVDPQFTRSYGLDASWSGRLGTLRIAPFLRQSLDEWAQFKEVDERGVATTTWANLAETTTYGSSLTASFRDLQGFEGSLTLNGQRESRDWDERVGRDARTSTRWSIRSNLNRRVTRSLNFQSSATYTPPRDLPQGTASATLMTNVSLRQRLFGNRATVNLSIADPLGIYRSSTRTADPSYIESNRERANARRATLSFSYNFGTRARSNAGRGNTRPQAPASSPSAPTAAPDTAPAADGAGPTPADRNQAPAPSRGGSGQGQRRGS